MQKFDTFYSIFFSHANICNVVINSPQRKNFNSRNAKSYTPPRPLFKTLYILLNCLYDSSLRIRMGLFSFPCTFISKVFFVLCGSLRFFFFFFVIVHCGSFYLQPLPLNIWFNCNFNPLFRKTPPYFLFFFGYRSKAKVKAAKQKKGKATYRKRG